MGGFFRRPTMPYAGFSAVSRIISNDIFAYLKSQVAGNIYQAMPGDDLQMIFDQIEDGAVLVLSPGEYGASSLLLNLQKRIHLFGQGSSLTCANWYIGGGTGATATQLHVRDLVMHGPIGVDGNRGTLENIRFYGSQLEYSLNEFYCVDGYSAPKTATPASRWAFVNLSYINDLGGDTPGGVFLEGGTSYCRVVACDFGDISAGGLFPPPTGYYHTIADGHALTSATNIGAITGV